MPFQGPLYNLGGKPEAGLRNGLLPYARPGQGQESGDSLPLLYF